MTISSDVSETVQALRLAQTRGHDHDWRSLFERVYPFVRARIWRYRVATTSTSEDVVQDTACELFEGLGRLHFGSREEFWGFVDKVLSTQAARSIRRASTRKRDSRRTQDDYQLDELVDHGPSPEQVSRIREQVREIETFLAKLPRRSSRMFMMRTAGGLSYREIAEQLGMPSDTAARVAYSRVRQQITTHFEATPTS